MADGTKALAAVGIVAVIAFALVQFLGSRATSRATSRASSGSSPGSVLGRRVRTGSLPNLSGGPAGSGGLVTAPEFRDFVDQPGETASGRTQRSGGRVV